MIQESVSLKYEPASEPLHISVEWLLNQRYDLNIDRIDERFFLVYVEYLTMHDSAGSG